MSRLRWLACAVFAAGALRAQEAPVGRQRPVDTAATAPAAVPLDTALERRTTAVASELRCVVCQGLSIQDSPSELAQQMRRVVREQLAAGKSETEVIDYFVSKYGEWILLSPRPEGFNLVAYLLPVAFLVGGAAAVVLAVRRWSAASASAAPSATAGDRGAHGDRSDEP